MKKIILFLAAAAMLLSIIGTAAYAAADVSLTSAWGYDVPSKSDDFRLSINQSGDIIVAEMELVNKDSNHSLYATLSYKKPDGTVETSDIKQINAYNMNPTPCVYFYIDRSYSAYCDMFVTFIDHDTLKPYVEAVNVNEHFNIEQDKYEVNGVVTEIDPIGKKILFEPTEQVTDKDGNIIMDYQKTYSLNAQFTETMDYLMHHVNILLAVNGRKYTLLNISDGDESRVLQISSCDLSPGRSVLSKNRSVIEYYDGFETYKTTKIVVGANAPVYVNGYNINNVNMISYPIDLYSLLGDIQGIVEFVDNDDDTIYDAVIINIYEHQIVEEIFENLQRIDFVSGDCIKFDSSDPMQVVNMFCENGNEISLSDIKSGDVLAMRVIPDTLAVSSDGRIKITAAKNFAYNGNAINIIDLGNKTVTGTINRGDSGLAYINDVCYPLGNFVDGNFDLVCEDYYSLRIGLFGTFYLDINNYIIGLDSNSFSWCNLGYILEAEYVSTAGENNEWQIKILNENGVETYSLNEPFTYNDITVNVTDGNDKEMLRYTKDNDNYFKNAPTGNIVEYRLNKDNKIKYIDCVDDINSLPEKSVYNMNTGKVGNAIIDENAVIFNLNGSAIEECNVETVADLINKAEYSGYVANMRNRNCWNVFVITSEKTSTYIEPKTEDKKQICVISSFYEAYRDGDIVYEVEYYTGGSNTKKTAIFNDVSETVGQVNFYNIKKGDVFVADIDETTNVVSNYTVLAQPQYNGRGIIPVAGAFAAAYGNDFTGKPTLENGIDYICGYINNIYKRGDRNNIEIIFGNKSTDIYTISINEATNCYMYTPAKIIQVSAGDWRGDYVTEYDGINATPIFVKLCDGDVTDVYICNGRVDKENVNLMVSSIN